MGTKTILWTFQATNKQNLIQVNLDIAKKGKLLRETESLLISAQNHGIRTNYLKATKDKT